MKANRTCSWCGSSLELGINWMWSRFNRKDYICTDCEPIRQRRKSARQSVKPPHLIQALLYQRDIVLGRAA